MAQSKEQLRRLREKYHLGEYSKKRGRVQARPASRSHRVKRGGNMARRKSGRRRGGAGGINGLLKPFVVGAIAGAFSDKIPVLNSLPPVATGAAGGYFVKKSVMGAAAGAAGTMFASQYVRGMLGSSGATSGW